MEPVKEFQTNMHIAHHVFPSLPPLIVWEKPSQETLDRGDVVATHSSVSPWWPKRKGEVGPLPPPQECHTPLPTLIIGPYSPAISSSKTIFNFSSSFQGTQGPPRERTLSNSINPLVLHGPDLGLGASYENSPVLPRSPSTFAQAAA